MILAQHLYDEKANSYYYSINLDNNLLSVSILYNIQNKGDLTEVIKYTKTYDLNKSFIPNTIYSIFSINGFRELSNMVHVNNNNDGLYKTYKFDKKEHDIVLFFGQTIKDILVIVPSVMVKKTDCVQSYSKKKLSELIIEHYPYYKDIQQKVEKQRKQRAEIDIFQYVESLECQVDILTQVLLSMLDVDVVNQTDIKKLKNVFEQTSVFKLKQPSVILQKMYDGKIKTRNAQRGMYE